ncbi:MAG: hypothetical protein DRP27_05415 [Thermotogae bacterium]|nr:MAG: hypothetical protein DRP27_05415 [Thermotogota bacterium]
MKVPVCERERGRKRSTTSILLCEIPYLFAWVVLWMRTRKKASASCVSVGDSSLSPVGECERGKSEAQQIFCNVKSSLYNLCVLFNVMNTRPLRKIADIAGCY